MTKQPSAIGVLEVRFQGGELDEVVGFGHFHLEQMTDTHWWMEFDDAHGRRAAVHLQSRGRIRSFVEESPCAVRVMSHTGRIQELERICAEAYQVIGILADEAGRFNDPAVTKVLDNLSEQALVHDDVLPFPSCEARSATE